MKKNEFSHIILYIAALIIKIYSLGVAYSGNAIEKLSQFPTQL
jgi:hypothetical protein